MKISFTKPSNIEKNLYKILKVAKNIRKISKTFDFFIQKSKKKVLSAFYMESPYSVSTFVAIVFIPFIWGFYHRIYLSCLHQRQPFHV